MILFLLSTLLYNTLPLSVSWLLTALLMNWIWCLYDMTFKAGWMEKDYEFYWLFSPALLDHLLYGNKLVCCEADLWEGTSESAWVKVPGPANRHLMHRGRPSSHSSQWWALDLRQQLDCNFIKTLSQRHQAVLHLELIHRNWKASCLLFQPLILLHRNR